MKFNIVVLLFLFLIFSGAFLGVVFLYQDEILDIYYRIGREIQRPENFSVGKLIEEVEEYAGETEKQVSTPPPLRVTEKTVPLSVATKTAKGKLTDSGVLAWTNQQRGSYGVAALAANPQLSLAAAIKAQDMLDKQYFAHESPTGAGPSDLAEETGYDFISVGENLAMGNFKNDEDLVQAWMDSPGHRENILNAAYMEIGIAVIQGVFEGEKVWMAVQEFGRPLSACPKVNENLKVQIENYEKQIDILGQELFFKESEISNFRPKRGPAYAQAVEEYNKLIEEYNDLVAEVKKMINLYNAQVQEFNACLTG